MFFVNALVENLKRRGAVAQAYRDDQGFLVGARYGCQSFTVEFTHTGRRVGKPMVWSEGGTVREVASIYDAMVTLNLPAA